MNLASFSHIQQFYIGLYDFIELQNMRHCSILYRFSVIFMKYDNPFFHYSFLGINFVPSPLKKSLSSQLVSTNTFITTYMSNRGKLPNNLNENQLWKLEQARDKNLKDLESTSKLIIQLRNQFEQMKKELLGQISLKTMSMTLQACYAYHVADLSVWQKIIAVMLLHYPTIGVFQKEEWLNGLRHYIRGNFDKFKSNEVTQFLIYESYLNDICNLKELIYVLLHKLEPFSRDNQAVRVSQLNSMQSIFKIIMKITKSQDINVPFLREQYKQFFPELMYAISVEQAYSVANIYVMIGFSHLDLTKEEHDAINHRILSLVRQFDQKVTLVSRVKLTYRIVLAWNYCRLNDPNLYTEFIAPTIRSAERPYVAFSVILSALLASDIKDIELFTFMLKCIEDSSNSETKEVHSIKHYLSIVMKEHIASSYHGCKQARNVCNFLKFKKLPIYSSCMLQVEESERRRTLRNVKGVQDNAPEQFWNQAIKMAFEEVIVEKYPSHKELPNSLVRHARVCQYEIDWFMIVSGQAWAIEFEGETYHRIINGKKTYLGKKNRRYQLLETYKIKLICVESQSIESQLFSHMRNYHEAKRYFIRLFETTKSSYELN